MATGSPILTDSLFSKKATNKQNYIIVFVKSIMFIISFFYKIPAFPVLLASLLFSQGSFLLAQVQLKHIIDYSESGEILFFQEIEQNNIEITLSPNFKGQCLWFFITRGTQQQEMTFRVKQQEYPFQPAFSYDAVNWETIENTWKKEDYYYFSFRPSEDTVEVTLDQQSRQSPGLKSSASVPYYTYQMYESYLSGISASPWLKKDTIGQSVQNRDIYLLTVTDTAIQDTLKKTVWINFRQHCDEDEPSYILEGLLDYLLSADACPEARDILGRTIYKIVPLINVDGVYNQLSRVNANGVDMNRCWSPTTDYSGEEPEIQAVHGAMDNWILRQGQKISFCLDMHSWGNNFDGGYKSSVSMSSNSYVEEQATFLNQLAEEDQWQQLSNWQFSTGSAGMARLELYTQHQLNILTSECTRQKRYDGIVSSEEGFRTQGVDFCKAIDNYLFHVGFVTSGGQPGGQYSPADTVYVMLDDLDERYSGTIDVTVTSQSGYSETVQLTEQQTGSGLFRTNQGLSTETGTPIHDDNKLQVQDGDTIKVYYQDNDFQDDNCFAVSVISNSVTVNKKPAMQPAYLENYPNPFSDQTTISFIITETTTVQVNIYNTMGQKVKKLINKKMVAGNHFVQWDGRNEKGNRLPADIYYCCLKSDSRGFLTKKMILKE